ncbi:MAG: recombinase RecA [Candidatus Aureabacteria bacterium]|nr:recombinase RecA [Candidatus Auribacterota bacterium]
MAQKDDARVDLKGKDLKEDDGKGKALEAAVAQIEKQFGQGSIMKLGSQAAKISIPTISTGALTLDIALGIGGLPRGRIIEIFGPESSGKTTLAMSVVANAQRAGGSAAFIDAEHAFDAAYAQRMGINLDNMLISQPDCGEDALNITEVLVRSNAVDVIIVDTVAALVPKAEIEGEMGDSHMGLQARLMSQALRKLTACINRSKTCCIFINQIREKIGVVFGNPETTPGGRALKFYSSIRLDLRRIESFKNSQGVVLGNRVRAKVVKNKLAPPFRSGEFEIYFGEGISLEGTILDVGVEQEIVEKKGAWFLYGTEKLGQGRDAARQALKGNATLAKEITAAIWKKLELK